MGEGCKGLKRTASMFLESSRSSPGKSLRKPMTYCAMSNVFAARFPKTWNGNRGLRIALTKLLPFLATKKNGSKTHNTNIKYALYVPCSCSPRPWSVPRLQHCTILYPFPWSSTTSSKCQGSRVHIHPCHVHVCCLFQPSTTGATRDFQTPWRNACHLAFFLQVL